MILKQAFLGILFGVGEYYPHRFITRFRRSTIEMRKYTVK